MAGSQTAQRAEETPQQSSVPSGGSAALPNNTSKAEAKPAFSFEVNSHTDAAPPHAAGSHMAALTSKDGTASGLANIVGGSNRQNLGSDKVSTAPNPPPEQTNSMQSASFMFGAAPSDKTPAFSFGSGVAPSSGTATAPAQSPPSLALAPATAQSSDAAAATESSSGLNFGLGTTSKSAAQPSASMSAPAFGLPPAQDSSKQTATGFTFGSAEAPQPGSAMQNPQSPIGFSFGSGTGQQTAAASATQSAPGFSFGSAPAGPSRDLEQGSAQTGTQVGGSGYNGFVFGPQPASGGSSFAPAGASGSATPNMFGGNSMASMPAGQTLLLLSWQASDLLSFKRRTVQVKYIFHQRFPDSHFIKN